MSSKKEDSLNRLIEECSEVIKAITKIRSYGEDSNDNGQLPYTNREHLIQEMGDVLALISIVSHYHNVSKDALNAAINAKLEKLSKYSDLVIRTDDRK